MKNLKYLLFYFFAIFCLSACSSDDDNGGDADSDGDFITAKVDGADWSTDSNYADLTVAQINSGIFSLQGSNNDGEAISVTIHNYNGPGTYTVGNSAADGSIMMFMVSQTQTGWINNYVTQLAGSVPQGQIQITSETADVVEGNFSFHGFNQNQSPQVRQITNGQFKAHIE